MILADGFDLPQSTGYLTLMLRIPKSTRLYPLTLGTYCAEACRYCPGLGHRLSYDRDLVEVRAQVKKARRAEYDAVLLPCNAIFRQDLDKIIEVVKSEGIGVLLRLNFRSLTIRIKNHLKSLRGQGVRLQIVLDDWDPSMTEILSDIDRDISIESYLVVVSQSTRLTEIIGCFPLTMQKKVSLVFPYHLSSNDGFLSSDEVYSVLKSIRRRHQHFEISPSYGLETYDPRVGEDFDFEPDYEPMSENLLEGGNILFSVVIPTFNNLPYVKNVVRHLSQQDLGKEHFEVIVVDDGSSDGTKEFFAEAKELFFSDVQWRYIYYPRPATRSMGDYQFRAGIARNLGVKFSRGSHLCFLDSDILTPKNFLSQLLVEHRNWEVIQARRTYLTECVSHESTNYDEVNLDKDTFIPEGGYWHKFFDNPTPWHLQENNWKYVCTYTLSMRTEYFKAVGWFRKNYHCYGFEDTDLGYRLVKAGCKLHLSSLNVLHLWHTNDRSEFKNSEMLRHMLLKTTANVFFRNQLDPKIYTDLHSLVHEEGFAKSFKRVLRGALAPSPLQKSLRLRPPSL